MDSNPNSELDSPRGGRLSHKGMLGGAGGGIFSTLSGSGGNSVHTSISNASAVSPPAQATTTTSSTAVHIAGSVAGGVAPTREHIGIARAPSGLSEEPSADDIPTYELQRPPSRQKFAAPQHLFEGMPPPTRVGTEKETSRGGKANNSSGGGGGESRRGLSSSPSQLEDFPSSRSTTARGGGGSSSNAALAPKYNPRDDGFADLDAGDAPFVIKLNSSVDTPPDKYSLYGDDGGGGGESVMHGQNRHHRRSYNSLTANQLAQSGHHSRSSSNASSNHWDHASAAGATEVDGIMSPLGYRPQTVGHAGPVKGARLPGVYPPVGAGTSSYSAPVTPVLPPARGKSAGESLRPQPGLSGLVRREGNNFLVMNQQPHAPLQQQPPTMPGHSRAGAYTVRELKGAPAAAGSGMGEYTAGPAVGRSGGWTESDSLRNLRLLVSIPFLYFNILCFFKHILITGCVPHRATERERYSVPWL